MKKVEKKIYPKYFQAILDGRKSFEIRLNDFDIQEGDTLVLKEWDKETGNYTGRELEREIGYVGKWKMADLTEFWPLKDIEEKGIQVISLK